MVIELSRLSRQVLSRMRAARARVPYFAVPAVVALRANIQMLRVHTRTIVTCVVQLLAFGHRAAPQFPSDTVRCDQLACRPSRVTVRCVDPTAACVQAACPDPATVRSLPNPKQEALATLQVCRPFTQ